MKKVFLNCMLLLCALIVGSGDLWAAEDDVHDMSITQQTGLNENASIPSITIEDDDYDYAVKQVQLGWRYNKTIVDVVTIEVSIGGASLGTETVGGKTSGTVYFDASNATGQIVISFTNHAGSGTGKGTFYVESVKLKEGLVTPHTVTYFDGGSITEASAGAGVTLASRSDIGEYSFEGWSITNIPSETVITPSYVTLVEGKYYPSSDITLYPIYSRSTGSAEVTESVTIADYATAHSWENSTKYATVQVDENVSANMVLGGNTGQYNSSTNTWRMYQTENSKMTINAETGYVLVSATITYSVSNKGILVYDGSNKTSGTAISLSGSESSEFSVGQTGDKTNGQVQISEISITYKEADYYLCIAHSRTGFTAGDWGTVCLPYAVKADGRNGAKFYNITGKTASALVVEEQTGDLVAGKPYLFQAEGSSWVAAYSGASASVQSATGLVGNLDEDPIDVPTGAYIITGNVVRLVPTMGSGSVICRQYRAYLDLSEVTTPVSAPDRYVEIPMAPNNATNIEAIDANDDAIKFIQNGKLFIKRNGVTYDVLGRIEK